MHQFYRANNTVHRAGVYTQFTTDATRLINKRQLFRFGDAVCLIECQQRFVKQFRQCLYAHFTARGALIDFGFIGGNGLCVLPTSGIATQGALGLGQALINLLNQQICHLICHNHGSKRQ